MEEKQLSEFFILELFKTCMRKSRVLEIASEHLQYHFLPSEEYKLIWKAIVDHYKLNGGELISLGLLAQQFRLNREVTSLLAKLSDLEIPPETAIIRQLEIFIKQMIFIDTHRELAEKYNKQDDEGAFELLASASQKISDFRLVKKKLFNNIIGSLLDRIDERKASTIETTSTVKSLTNKIPTGIMFELDSQLRGGVDRGDTLLWMAPSGGGKSKAMKFSGYYNSKIGNRVVHIQAEGTRKAAEEEYDAAFIGGSVSSIESGMISEEKRVQLERVIDQIQAKDGEIHLKAFEQFGSVSLLDVKHFMDEIVDTYGTIDLLIIDYLELIEPGNNKYYKEERHRREAIANGFKNLCMEYNCAGISATQSMDVSHDLRNNDKFVLRREHISEFKGMVKPFSYFVTINATDDEIKENTMRIHIDKFRKYRAEIPTFKIATMFDNERFYDNSRTQILVRYGKPE